MKEQIELIRKDLNSLYEYRQDNWNYTGCHNDIVRHLNVIEEMDIIMNQSSVIEKLDNEIKSVINIIKKQPSNDDEWILGRLNGFLSIIGGE